MEPDAETIAALERQRRLEVEEDYHGRLSQKEAEVDELKQRQETLEKEARKSQRSTTEQNAIIYKHEKTIKDQQQQISDNEAKMRMWQTAFKGDQADLQKKDAELKAMQQKKMEFFQEKKKALAEVADARALVQSLHAKVDGLEKANAEQRQQIEADNAYKADMGTIHRMLEETFTEVKSENLPMPEFVQKIQEWQSSMKRTDSHTSVGPEKEARQSLGNQLDRVGYNSEEESEDDEEGDRTLTVDVEVAEMKQKIDQLESDVEAGDEKEKRYLSSISALTRELETWRKTSAEEKRAKENLDLSSITAFDIEPASPPKPTTKPAEVEKKQTQQKLGFSTINAIDFPPSSPLTLTATTTTSKPTTTPSPPPAEPQILSVIREPTARDIWTKTPSWLFFLLAIMVAALAYCWITALQERALWLGANDTLRTGALRVEMGRRMARCGAQGDFAEGMFAPLWLAIEKWLELPMPVMLT